MLAPEAASAVSLPHNFSGLFQDSAANIFFCGSGFSHGLVDSVWDLINKCPQAAAVLDCTCIKLTDENENDYLYLWSEDIEKQLIAKAVPHPKLELAKSLGLLSDHKWMGETGTKVPLSEYSPRHRITARFVREKIWQHLWTLNWDCFLERALECIGFERSEGVSSQSKVPWQTKYIVFITKKDANDGVVIFKPNGCVDALFKARELIKYGDESSAKELIARFLITKSELKDRDDGPTNTSVWAQLATDLMVRGMLAIGWSMSEEYLQGILKEARNGKDAEEQKLTVVDIIFRAGHSLVAGYYGLAQPKVFMNVAKPLNQDMFFLWLQAAYVLHRFSAYEISTASLEKYVQGQIQDNFFIQWADGFLPSWARLCSKAGLVAWLINGKPISTDEINMDLADYYIPMNDNIQRPDLKAAANLIHHIAQNGNVNSWDFNYIRGCLWQDSSGHLVIPLPSWDPDDGVNELRAFLPLIKEVTDKLQFIRKISILPLHHDATHTALTPATEALKARVLSHAPHAALSKAENIGVVAISDL